MSSSTTFLLTPASQQLDTSPSLNILPFSLGSSSNPYTSTTAPLSTYFRPRPCPPGNLSIPEGTPVAAFRGRQLVGQTISVPKGYHGIILSTGKRPDRGGVEVRTTRNTGKAKEGQFPPTPASSAASVASDEIAGVRRSPRKPTGTGQIASSRPKPRQAPPRPVVKKRFRLDSDSESDEEERKPPVEVKPRLARTPSKKMKITGMMGVSPVKGEGLPAIVVQAPTPRKPTVIVTSLFSSGEDHENTILEERHMAEEAEQAEDSASSAQESPNCEDEVKEEDIVPSPSTEDDPPTFPIASSSRAADRTVTTPPPIRTTSNADTSDEGDYDTSIRALRPTSTFDSFTLWTPDAPLAGFRADELKPPTAGTETEDKGEGEKLEKGWWRTGGAGEGGDEVVRAMGEWLGLVEILNKPVYLEESADEDDSDAD